VISRTLANLRYRKARLALSALAICLGVAFVTGTQVLGASMDQAYFNGFAAGAKNVDAAVTPPSFGKQRTGSEDAASLAAGDLASVRSVAGVAAADGRVVGQAPLIGSDGRVIRNGERPGFGINIASDPALRGFTVASGTLPTRTGEIAVDDATAAAQHFRLGQTVRVVDHNGVSRAFLLTATIDLGADKEFEGGTVAAFTTADAFSVTGRPGYDMIVARAGPGVSQPALVSRVRALPALAGDTVQTGSQLATTESDAATHFTQQFTTAILIFALIALAVACVVIYNTFTILIAQRSRELALMRCVGASKRQVFGGMLAESMITGILASVVGIAGGVGLGWALQRLFSAFGAPIPAGPLVLTPAVALESLGVGVLVTTAAAVLPARSATRVAPVAALGTASTDMVTRKVGWGRVAAGVVLAALGVLITAQGTGHVNGASGFVMITAGGCLCFLALLAFGPLIVPPLTALFGLAFRGITMRLATANARRHPHRVATTTAALTIGITIMTVFSVVTSSAQASSDAAIAANYPFDYLVQPGSGAQVVPPRVVSALSRSSALGLVATRYFQQDTVDGQRLEVGTFSRNALDVSIRPVMLSGSLSSVVAGTAAVNKSVSQHGDVQVAGRTYRVVAVYNAGGSSPMPDVLISEPDYLRAFHPAGPDEVYIDGASGVTASASAAAVGEAVASDPLLEVNTLASYKASLNSRVNTVLALFDVLLGLAIAIALVGIANTLSLSVIERTAESAVLRAVGMTRGQLRAMLLAEALLMALLGICLGVGLGATFGWVMVHAFILSADGTGVLSIPFAQLGIYVAVGAAAAVAAAVLPSRKAARASVVAALAGAQ
jgi:putative ABC transport system permease protein